MAPERNHSRGCRPRDREEMMGTADITSQDIEGVAAKLESYEGLDDRERDVLAAIFALAGQSAANYADGDVEGFMPTAVEYGQLHFSGLPGYLVPAVQKQGTQGILISGFSWGMNNKSFGDGSVTPQP